MKAMLKGTVSDMGKENPIILVVNVGSTSLKYRLFDMRGQTCLAKGAFDRVGTARSAFSWEQKGMHGSGEINTLEGYSPCIGKMMQLITEGDAPVIASADEIDGVGFKAVLAGKINYPVRVTEELYGEMEKYVFVTPAHNPPYMAVMRSFEKMLPDTPLVASFETGFHSTIPDYARVYPFPKVYRDKYGLEKYGFHGASHSYAAWKIPQLLGRKDLRIVSCHLGGSSSLCAIKNGTSMDSSMGFSPQAGILNNNRNGDLDVFAVLYLMEKENLSPVQMREMLSKHSGLLGLSGISGDMRDLESSDSDNARITIEHFVYSVKKYIGAFAAEMNGIDVLSFSGGIGENGNGIRSAICRDMDYLGIRLDEEKNAALRGTLPPNGCVISSPDSMTKVLVLPTNEEWMVAMNTLRVLTGKN